MERKEGQLSTTNHQVTLVDLPGASSLTTISSQTSLDEQNRLSLHFEWRRSLLINVVDAFLTLES
ncbi:FeoB small GTPase domain-containing protein [Escherichia coli]